MKSIEVEFVSINNMSAPAYSDLKEGLYKYPRLLRTKLAHVYKHFIAGKKYTRWNERFRDIVLFWHTMSEVFVDSLKTTTPDLLMIDDPVFLAPVVRYARCNNIPLVAFCHNIETLSREQVTQSCQRDMFRYELDLIAQCDLVVTISQEETFLLKNLGMNPVYLPYFPSPQIFKRFKGVREKRKCTQKSDYLLMGTAHNLPTLDGMKQIIDAVGRDNILKHDRLIIAGYGTSERLIKVDNPRIELRGELSEPELDELLSTTKGCIVYQDSGAGALTKISELLSAGVPVIINSHAARSHHNLPGIYEFDDLLHLSGQLEAAAKSDQFPQILSPPDASLLHSRIADLITHGKR